MTDLRKLAEQATPGPWEPGHLADDSHPCNCKGIFDGSYAGGLFHAVVDNELPISEGGNDGPPLEEAKANLRYIAAAHPQAVLSLLDTIAALQANNELLRQAHTILRDVNNQLVEHNTIDSNKFFFDMVSYLYNLHQSQGQPDPIETKYPPFESLSMDSAKCPECGHENCPCERISVNAPPEPSQGQWYVEGTRIMEGDLIVNGSSTFTPNENIVRHHNANLAALKAENERLREALSELAEVTDGDDVIGYVRDTARYALEGKDG